jgi:TonB family protein
MNTKLYFGKIATGKVLFALIVAICLTVVSVVNTEGSTNRAKTEKVKGKVYEKVEQMPEFPGGQTELINFLMKSVKYPQQAMESAIQGKVFVSFVVGKKGSVLNAKIERGVDPLLDAEALRVVNSMPKWIPGKEKGKDVAVQFTLPISFRLQ